MDKMDIRYQMRVMITRKPLLVGWVLATGWLVGTLVSAIATNDFSTLFALSQAVLIQLESNLVYALWFIGKVIVVYVILKTLILLVQLCRPHESSSRMAMTTKYIKDMMPFFEQMFVFFFTLFIDNDRMGKRIEAMLNKKVNGNAVKSSNKQGNLFNLNRKVTTKLVECFKNLIRKCIRLTMPSVDVEKCFLFTNNIAPKCKSVKKPPMANELKGRKKCCPVIRIILCNGPRRVNVRALISSSSTCSLITEKAAEVLQLEIKPIFTVLVRESITQPIRVCSSAVQVRMEAVKPQEHISHQMEMLLVSEIASRTSRKGTVDVLIGQDIFNWTVNILPMQQVNFLANGTAQFDTKYGETNMGLAHVDVEQNTGDDDQEPLIKTTSKKAKALPMNYKVATLPWRVKKDDEEPRGCIRDMTLLFSFPLILGMFAYFDLLLLLTLLIVCLIALCFPCWRIFDRDIFASPQKLPRRILHSATENLFIFFYAIKLICKWIWKQQSSSSKDPVLYKPTLKVRVRSLDTECVCRVLFDTTRAQSYITRSVAKHLGKLRPQSSTGRITVQMEALHDANVSATADLVLTKRTFADYLPTPARELREVIAVQHGIQLTDDTPEWQPFGTVDIIIGTDLLTRSFLLGRSACLYLGPNLTLTPSQFGWTLAGSHFPLLNKSLDTIFTSHTRVLKYLSHHLIPFVVSLMTKAIVVSVLWDTVHYLALVNDINTFFQYQYKLEYLDNCDNFRMKSDSVFLLNILSYFPKMASCWLYQNTF